MGKIMDYTYSYSGADCRAYAFFPDDPGNMVDLSSLATISISVHEAKSPVRRLGERGVSGYTRGIRTIAGSMVFLVIEDHPLWKLIHANNNYSSTDWNRDSDRSISRINQRKLSTMIRPFNIMLVYQTEIVKVGNSSKVSSIEIPERASLIIEKIDILNEGLVTSVNDMVTEVQMQFVAQDYYNLDKSAQSLNKSIQKTNTKYSETQSETSAYTYSKSTNEDYLLGLFEAQKVELSELKELVKEQGKDSFKRTILSLHKTRGDCNYEEVRQQFVNNVLENENFINDNINGKWHRKPQHIIDDRVINEEYKFDKDE